MKTTKLLLSGAILTALTACGGGGSDNNPADPQTPVAPKSVPTTPQNNNGATQPTQDAASQNPNNADVCHKTATTSLLVVPVAMVAA